MKIDNISRRDFVMLVKSWRALANNAEVMAPMLQTDPQWQLLKNGLEKRLEDFGINEALEAYVQLQKHGDEPVYAAMGWYEGTYSVTAYMVGRLITLEPSKHKWWVDEYSHKDAYREIEREARERLAECYPTAQIVTEDELRERYKNDGYTYPNRYSLLSVFLCLCGEPLYYDRGSKEAGRNTPHGNPWHQWLGCRACGKYYNCMSQEFTDGVRDSWGVRESREDKGSFHPMSQPKFNRINPFGFHETILVKKTEEVKENDGSI